MLEIQVINRRDEGCWRKTLYLGAMGGYVKTKFDIVEQCDELWQADDAGGNERKLLNHPAFSTTP